MENSKDFSAEFPSVLDRAYKQYKKNRWIKDIMTREVTTTTIETTMEEAARIMGIWHIGSLIVFCYDTPVGIVTERDLLSKVIAEGDVPGEVKVERVMSYPLVTICSTAKIKEAAKMMIDKKGRLTVFESFWELGIVSFRFKYTISSISIFMIGYMCII